MYSQVIIANDTLAIAVSFHSKVKSISSINTATTIKVSVLLSSCWSDARAIKCKVIIRNQGKKSTTPSAV